jgi:hypothetical protein
VLLKYDDRVKALRQSLRAMTESGRKPDEHRDDLKAITKTISNTIRVLDHELSEDRYTCGMHALSLELSEEYVAIASHGLGLVYAGPDFFEWVIANRHLDEATDGADGDFVMYFSQGRWTHIARMAGAARAISKWGMGLLCDHDLSEVPEQYGDQVRFFHNPGADASLDLFVRYAEARGMQFEKES